ncbi:hypothetical protein HDU91_001836, partial [Kappamyces sp. JEL0680]
SPPVGWIQGAESEPSKGGIMDLDREAQLVASTISLLDFQLDGGTAMGFGSETEPEKPADRPPTQVVKFDSLEAGVELPVICIHTSEEDLSAEGVGSSGDASKRIRIPQTHLPPLH